MLPNVRSILMDEYTLISHRELWTEEKQQHPAESLEFLTPEEQDVYSRLKRQRWALKVRLEQERIAWDYAWNRILGTPSQ
jgi:hypothetical protein